MEESVSTEADTISSTDSPARVSIRLSSPSDQTEKRELPCKYLSTSQFLSTVSEHNLAYEHPSFLPILSQYNQILLFLLGHHVHLQPKVNLCTRAAKKQAQVLQTLDLFYLFKKIKWSPNSLSMTSELPYLDSPKPLPILKTCRMGQGVYVSAKKLDAASVIPLLKRLISKYN